MHVCVFEKSLVTLLLGYIRNVGQNHRHAVLQKADFGASTSVSQPLKKHGHGPSYPSLTTLNDNYRVSL